MAGLRNKFEKKVSDSLGSNIEYETIKLPYTTHHNYLPDFIDVENKTIYEAKGLFDQAGRSKMKAVKDQHPDWRIVMIFQNPNRKISKRSITTYAGWCEKNGIEWMTID
ncbi:endodeoxyribonuclease [Agrobacterium tumefaciens]|uniref:Endodeoxyribonuclease n=1 Tax=Agrobacterium tumefaciens TaxID=358 RepID=A0AAJ4N6J2_AGRTU|nr:endodeoxyribonuclease [Agrobacterium tumefaciens]